MAEGSIQAWDEAAATFDRSVDHGLLDQEVRSVWRDLLARLLPPAPTRVADLGCGTGTLALLAAELGHHIHGVDFAERMLVLARAKAGGQTKVTLSLGDGADPPLADQDYDVVMCRHVLWALPDPAAALDRWTKLLRPGGRLVLIEGRWSTGVGLTAAETTALLAPLNLDVTIERLSDPRYWGGDVTDERYVALALLRS